MTGDALARLPIGRGPQGVVLAGSGATGLAAGAGGMGAAVPGAGGTLVAEIGERGATTGTSDAADAAARGSWPGGQSTASTRRMPRYKVRMSWRTARRLAARTLVALSPNEPPRATRVSCSLPMGSVTAVGA